MSVDLYYDAKDKQMYITVPEDLNTHDISQIVGVFNEHDFETEDYYVDLGKVHNLDNVSLSLIYFLAGVAEKENKTIQIVDCNDLIREILDECNIYKNVVY